MNTKQNQISGIIQKVLKKEIQLGLNDPLSKIVTSSLTFVIILGEIERTFDIEIPEEEMETENFESIQAIYDTVERVFELEA